MKRIIGNKETFAVGIEILKHESLLWVKSCILINGVQLGDFEDDNILGPFMASLKRIATDNESLWDKEFEGLNCREIFYLLNPFYNNPDDFFDLDYETQGRYVKYDKFRFGYGENFDSWAICCLVTDGLCKFSWVHYPNRDEDSFEVRNNIQCFELLHEDIQNTYLALTNFISENR